MSESQDLKILVIIGSTREGRFSEKPAQWIIDEIQKIDGINAELVDLRDHPLPFYNELKSPKGKNGQYSNRVIQKWSDLVAGADGFIVVTPEYNHGYPAVLKNAFDHLYPEWNNKAIGFVSYGSALGARVIEQLRLVAIELQMAPISRSINIPGTVYVAAMDLAVAGETKAFEPLTEAATNFLNQLVWWTRALKAAK